MPETEKRLRRLFAQPPQRFYLATAVHITDDRTIEIEGCRRVEEFEEGHIRLNMGRYSMELYGYDLQIRNMDHSRLALAGHLQRIDFSAQTGERP